jgi:hypothetical protein
VFTVVSTQVVQHVHVERLLLQSGGTPNPYTGGCGGAGWGGSVLAYVAGICFLLALPMLAKATYFSENALLTGANTPCALEPRPSRAGAFAPVF